MDYLDIIKGKYFQLQSGKYYMLLPKTANPLISGNEMPADNAVGIPFDYETIDPAERRYKQLLQNLIDTSGATLSIKTQEPLEWRNDGYIVTMNGGLYRIVSVTEDVNSSNLEARALFAVPVGTEYILRLVEEDNPWGIS